MRDIHVIDVETTGLDPEVDAIVEIALVSVAVDPPRVRAVAIDVMLDPGVPIPPEASAIHHITNAMCAGKQSFEDIRNTVLGYEDSGIFAAHNASFDSGFIGATREPWICTMRVAKHLWPDAPGYGNQVLRYWLNLDVETEAPPHRAGSDALVTAELLVREIEALQNVDDPIAKLLELTAAPVLLRTVNFGKHRGESWRNVPLDYIQWAGGKQWDDPDVARTIKAAMRGEFAD